MALITGLLLVFALGILHYLGLMAIRQGAPRREDRPHLSIVTVFGGLLVVHLLEILVFAAIYRGLIAGGWFGGLDEMPSQTWTDLIYFSGMNFVTLGYTDIKTDGAIKLISMMQSLGGFMILTWSATFIYSVWGQDWTKS
ncbi:hypothetical protein E0K89_005895 [Aquicoccus sp. SCR17]|nr:hypothetical protein [Carideicomes alvinocaridis]